MRVVHVPFGYYPDVVGGTEVYVAELARELAPLGVESIVAAPTAANAASAYDCDGVSVRRFAVRPAAAVHELYGVGDPGAASALTAILDETGASVLHLHAFTRAASLAAARAARRRGVAVVFTYHTPTASCVRGTLLREGRHPCDGELIARRCASCLLESGGVPKVAREAIVALSPRVGSAVAAVGATGRWVTALRARELTLARHDAFRLLLREADAAVAVCAWVRALLLRAGATPGRLVLSRQGTPTRNIATSQTPPPSSRPLRLAFVGRLHPAKGVHIVLSALAARRDLPIVLDVFGAPQDVDGARYRDELLRIARADDRIRFRGPLSSDRVVRTLGGYHATVVPSQWLETGPLTVLESFAAGVPVIGSNLGGIAELVSHDRDGWLVPHGSRAAWESALARLTGDASLVARLRDGVRLPRTTADVAREMAALYHGIAPRTTPRENATPAAVL